MTPKAMLTKNLEDAKKMLNMKFKKFGIVSISDFEKRKPEIESAGFHYADDISKYINDISVIERRIAQL